MLPAMFVFLKPCYLQCLSQTIRVTLSFWEADSRHAGELSVFFVREKANSPLSVRGQKKQKTFKSDTATLEFEVSFCTRFFGTGDPLLPMGFARFGAKPPESSISNSRGQRISE